MDAKPHPMPMPAAAPPLSPEELLVGSGAPAVAPAAPAGIVEDVVAEEELVPDEDDEVVVAVESIPPDVCAADVEVVCVAVPEATVAVSNISRWRAMVCPSVALGWVSHPDFIAMRTVNTKMYQRHVHEKSTSSLYPTVAQYHGPGPCLQT
jgi:hypothetical protein